MASDPTRARVPRRLCLALAAAIIFQLFYLGAQPSAAGLIPPPWDKLAHLAVYSLLTVLLWVGTAGRVPLAVVFAVAGIGALDEFRQAAVPGRVADAGDFLVDLGAAGSAGALLLYARRRKTAVAATQRAGAARVTRSPESGSRSTDRAAGEQ